MSSARALDIAQLEVDLLTRPLACRALESSAPRDARRELEGARPHEKKISRASAAERTNECPSLLAERGTA